MQGINAAPNFVVKNDRASIVWLVLDIIVHDRELSPEFVRLAWVLAGVEYDSMRLETEETHLGE